MITVRHVFVIAPDAKKGKEIWGQADDYDGDAIVFHFAKDLSAFILFNRKWTKERATFLFDSRPYTREDKDYRRFMMVMAEEAVKKNLNCIYVDE